MWYRQLKMIGPSFRKSALGPNVPAYVKTILRVLFDTKEQLDSMRKWIGILVGQNNELKAENESLRKVDESRNAADGSAVKTVGSNLRANVNVVYESEIEKRVLQIGSACRPIKLTLCGLVLILLVLFTRWRIKR
ncbi:unnamed protein product [Haemonchus placei]|uniref:Reverse transcriptase domain-containing protein n=1 Tax=Haemonchus placei TaxID=6290 RepID=A0A0N4VX30_HAEPC|nr:unnamed protein product [Haemonchus placei]